MINQLRAIKAIGRHREFTNFWSWIRNNLLKMNRHQRRLSPNNVGKVRQRPRRSLLSSTSTYHSALEENNAEWVSRVSPSNPSQHEDSFLEPFRPWKIDAIETELALVSQEIKEQHAFNPADASPHISVLQSDPLTMHRLPIAQSTDGIRGKVGFQHGTHVLKFTWPLNQRGTNAVIGVATKDHSLYVNGYTSLLGTEESGFGWDISKGFCFHNSKEKDAWLYPNILTMEGNYIIPEEIYCILDMDEGYLAFSTKERFLGVAFRGLKGKTLYPMVAAVWGHCEVKMEYMGSIHKVPPLSEMCRRKIRKEFLKDGRNHVDDLPIPETIKQYVGFDAFSVW